MKYMKLLVLSLLIAVGVQSASKAQPTALTGTTTRQASQLVFWYDQAFGPEGDNLGRFSYIQVTNGSATSDVRIHLQFFRSFNPDPENPLTAVRCQERDFTDRLTPNDTAIYDLFFLERNDPLNPGAINFEVDDTKGFVVVTAVDANGEAIAFQHLFGNSYVFDINNVSMHRLNAMGRDAVDFSTGSIVADGTVLDGVSAGLILIQPEFLKFNFEQTLTKSPNFPNLADIISISFRDDYDAGVGGAYSAQPGDVTWNNPLVFDLFENPESCDTIPQDCFFDIGFNEVIGVANPLLDDGKLYCSDNFTPDGWARFEVIGYDPLENELGIVAISTSNDTADAVWMYSESAVPPGFCTSDEDCPEGQECDLTTNMCEEIPGFCTSDEDCPFGEECNLTTNLCEEIPGFCTSDADCPVLEECDLETNLCEDIPCTSDNDCPAGSVCSDFVEPDMGICIPFTPTPTPTIAPTITPTVAPSFIPRQGSSGSCTSVAGAAPVELGSALMSMLIPLLPAVGIGVRRFAKRNRGKKAKKST